MDHPLYVAIVWHMHQPYYRDMRTGEVRLPWVRLHAAKDYLHMGQVLAQHPDVHLTLNVVPSLTDQLLAWAEGRAEDQLVQLAEQRGWSEAEKRLILNLCYSISWDNVIRRHPRYSELLDRRPQARANPSTLSAGDYRDLLAWFNLAWIDPNWLEHDRVLAGLVAKRHGYSNADLHLIHDKQREIAAGVLPLYRQLIDAGQLEVSTTPYYHPILPLLIDSSSARRPSSGLPLPGQNLHAAEDAAAQLQSAVAAHTHRFGSPPRGLWPSEGAVSFELLPFVQGAGFQWLASDEALLAASLGQPLARDGSGIIQQPHVLYKPYRVMAGPNLGPWIIFRDHELSDRIGFLYHRLPGRQAAEDLIYRLLEIRSRLNDPSRPYLVSIILDGENCWESYEHNGDVFLHALYEMLAERSSRNELAPVTVSEYLAEHASGGTLARLATGSWINGDLTTWIGEPEHNRAWEALIRTRTHLRRVSGDCAPESPAPAEPFQDTARAPLAAPLVGQGVPTADMEATSNPAGPGRAGGHEPDTAAAWRALYVAEGSDWFWWYSRRNRSDQDAIYDQLFRHALATVYEALGHEAPAWLEQPIRQMPMAAAGHSAAGYISPQLTAAPYPGEAWSLAAALWPADVSSGAMQRTGGLIERLLVGHDLNSLYLRLDLRDLLALYDVEIYLGANSGRPVNQRLRARGGQPGSGGFALGWQIALPAGQGAPFFYRATGYDQWQAVGPITAATGPKVLEVALSLNVLGLETGRDLSVVVSLATDGLLRAQLPEQGMAVFSLLHF